MSKNDHYEAWRQNEATHLSTIMQRKIHIMQNPTDCRKAKKLLCFDNAWGCGIGNF